MWLSLSAPCATVPPHGGPTTWYAVPEYSAIAPGLVAKSDLNFVDVEDDGAPDNDGIVFVLALDATF